MESRVQQALAKADEYIGILYSPWNPNASCYGDHGPFWSFNGPAPSLERVERELLNCAGLINIIRRELGLKIPGAAEQTYYAGGTYEWFTYLDRKKKLHHFDSTKHYPKGTLLLRCFRNKDDDGHLAIVRGKQKVIHSIRNYGVIHDSVWPTYYEFVCLPEDWLQ
jgi:cell wall-associated NlpC family hydrolase